MTATDGPSGTARISAISTVGMDISASTTTTETAESAACLDTINATMASPNIAATATVSTTISRLVREPASNQLNTSAPVPSVPSQWSRDGFAHTW